MANSNKKCLQIRIGYEFFVIIEHFQHCPLKNWLFVKLSVIDQSYNFADDYSNLKPTVVFHSVFLLMPNFVKTYKHQY